MTMVRQSGADQVPPPAHPSAAPKKVRRRHVGGWLVLPTLVLLALVVGYPIVRAVWLSFFTERANTDTSDVFVGLHNYQRALFGADHVDFWNSAGVTILFTLITIVLEITIGTLLALLMQRARRGRGLVRASVLIPWAIPTAVTALLWKWMLQPAGIVNAVTGQNVIWTGAVWPARIAVIVAQTWKAAPFVALLVLAGLQLVPPSVYEAATVDGASAWQRFWRITIPMIWPSLVVAVLFRGLDSLRMYDLPAILTEGANGTTTLSLFTYQTAIDQARFGYGSALSTITFVLIFLVALAFVRILGKRIAHNAGPGTVG